MVFYLNEFIFMWLYCKLHLNIFFKFLSAVNLIKNEFIVKGVTNNYLEFIFEWLKIFIHLKHIFFTINDVHEFRVIYLLLHPKVNGLHFSVLFFQFLLLS